MKLKNYFLALSLSLFYMASAQTGTVDSASFVSGGTTRTYTYYIPKLYDSLKVAVPLVINMHGASGTSAKQQTAEDFRKIADTANFIIVHPQGLSIDIYPGIPIKATGWNVLGTVAAWETDKTFILNLLDTLEVHYKINASRVYLTGFSEGGFMCYDFACFVRSRFAAVASISGSMVPAHFSACDTTTQRQPIPFMEIHGTNDPVISYLGTGTPATTDVDTMVNYWVKYNHCNPVPDSVVKLLDIVDSATIDTSTVVHYIYTGGTKGATVELYKVLNGGHQVPSAPPVPTGYGSGHTNEDFTAAKAIWRFVSKYNLDSLGVTPVIGSIAAPVTGINQVVESAGISVYPNPSNGAFTIYVENNENTTIQILNLLGSVIYEEKTAGKYTTINLSGASKGIYFYKISNTTGIIKSGKIIID